MIDKNPKSNPKLPTSRPRFEKLLRLIPLALLNTSAFGATAPPVGSLHSVTLAWNAVSAANLQGYRLYFGETSGQYVQTIDTGAAVSYSVDYLEYGKTYYFAISSVDTAGVEGDLSSEIAVTIAPPPLPVVGGLVSNASGQRSLKWSFPAAAAGSSPEFIIYSSTDLVTWTETATVSSSDFSGGNSESLNFTWSITQAANKRMFFKLTARNWMGNSTMP